MMVRATRRRETRGAATASVKVRWMEDIPVIVMDVRERPDEGVQHEDQPRQDDHECDDEPQVHREPPFQQLAVRSPFGSVAPSGISSFVLRKNRKARALSGCSAVRLVTATRFASRQTRAGRPCCPALELRHPAVGRLRVHLHAPAPKAHRAELEVLVTLGLAASVESPTA